ncbi:hypothetical protein [Flavobacterium subsaxonicum]|uniref:Uncharacterized protein n=1 Tax=Flavobacterium subsaxonicum WB 4.1-42 = DSM 21790 TaxID=1121898 RepID=A0A0A2MK29_9FLAO|nr:hypothetical protein [Flavobacterium subsaxonicum]KGO91951.1 hypothetical protein Q766_15010 [Flavobacterium subsaxonicum WB 4.1-42 = DSM 21790]
MGAYKKIKREVLFDDTMDSWNGKQTIKRIINFGILGLIAVVAFALNFPGTEILKVASTAIMLAGASFISGAFLGFLFGIPRTDAAVPPTATGSNPNGNIYKPNTNLEQISDWLTKILVGVGLTQIEAISAWFRALIKHFESSMGNNTPIIGSIIIYFAICGFILGFLWSRLYMAGAILEAEMEQRIADTVQNTVDERGKFDAKALSIVNNLLDPDISVDPVTQDELNDIVSQASPVVKVTIFNHAQNFRQKYWRKPEDRFKIERTIPVFKTLIFCDTDDKYHRNHGQLGYALKDKNNPDYKAAEEEFTKAMQIRNRLGKEGHWLLYEFNRAFCRIKINEMGNAIYGQDLIYQDIKAAAKMPDIKNIIDTEEPFVSWLKTNNLSV